MSTTVHTCPHFTRESGVLSTRIHKSARKVQRVHSGTEIEQHGTGGYRKIQQISSNQVPKEIENFQFILGVFRSENNPKERKTEAKRVNMLTVTWSQHDLSIGNYGYNGLLKVGNYPPITPPDRG